MFGGTRSIVLELQEAATNRSNDITDLLRKCLLVATKLRLEDFKKWVNSELHGYTTGDVPQYRRLQAQMKVMNPFHGLQPFFMPAELEERLCDIEYRAAIGNAVSVIESHSSGDKLPPTFPLPPETRNYLLANMRVQVEPVRIVSESQLEMLIDAVRSTILEWALRLEEEGILGEGMTFTNDEKEKAAKSQEIHIANFQGVLGDVTKSEVTQNLTLRVQQGDFNSVRSALSSRGVDDADIDELQRILGKEPKPQEPGKFGPCISSWMGKMISKAASGTWEIGTGAAGELLATVIAAYYGFGS